MDMNTVYRPKTLPDHALPLLLWGNGACSDNGLMHGAFLRQIASHGYIIVAAGHARDESPLRAPKPLTPPGTPAPPPPNIDLSKFKPVTTPDQLIAGLDWAARETVRPGSPFYGKIDLSRVAVAGHSCGGLQAMAVAADPRIDTVLIFDSGVFTGPTSMVVGKDALGRIHTPMIYVMGGPTDIAHANALDDYARLGAVPVFFADYPVGHDGTFWTEPDGGHWAQVAVAWLDWRLKGDAAASGEFVGHSCGLCGDHNWTVMKKGID